MRRTAGLSSTTTTCFVIFPAPKIATVGGSTTGEA
jgi:hypothetical protein